MRLSAPIHALKRLARRMSRDTGMPLHQALDAVAQREGFARWSHLAHEQSDAAADSPLSQELWVQCRPGDLILLGARPGHGKTLLGLELLVLASKNHRRGVFFTLDYTEAEVRARLPRTGRRGKAETIEVVASDDISATFVHEWLRDAPAGTVAVIDFLQLLDQRRTKPVLAQQLAQLRNSASDRGWIIACLSQIDRSYDPELKPVPDLQDVRLPNPADLGLFDHAVFFHDGRCGMHRPQR